MDTKDINMTCRAWFKWLMARYREWTRCRTWMRLPDADRDSLPWSNVYEAWIPNGGSMRNGIVCVLHNGGSKYRTYAIFRGEPYLIASGHDVAEVDVGQWLDRQLRQYIGSQGEPAAGFSAATFGLDLG